MAFSMFFSIGCNNLGPLPAIVPLEDSIREIINSKGVNYNFLEDRLYRDKMEGLVNFLAENKHISNGSFLLANLSDDNIPEIIVFEEKDPSNKKDTGHISVYAFDGSKYNLLDRVSMNYDIGNYTIKAGYIAPTTKGFYVNNRVAGNCGITYGFTLVDGRLINIFDEKKINLVSSIGENPIEDIDQNGILNFSIAMDNPEINREGEKVLIWYEWDGLNGGKKVLVEYYDSNGLIIEGTSSSQRIDELEESIYNPNNLVFNNLLNTYSSSISSEYRDYLILKRAYILNKDYYDLIGNEINLKLNKLSEDIVSIEKYLFKYPYSDNIDELVGYLNFYRSKLLVNPIDYSQEEFNLILIQMENLKNLYDNFYLSSILDSYITSFRTLEPLNLDSQDIIQ